MPKYRLRFSYQDTWRHRFLGTCRQRHWRDLRWPSSGCRVECQCSRPVQSLQGWISLPSLRVKEEKKIRGQLKKKGRKRTKWAEKGVFRCVGPWLRRQKERTGWKSWSECEVLILFFPVRWWGEKFRVNGDLRTTTLCWRVVEMRKMGWWIESVGFPGTTEAEMKDKINGCVRVLKDNFQFGRMFWTKPETKRHRGEGGGKRRPALKGPYLGVAILDWGVCNYEKIRMPCN